MPTPYGWISPEEIEELEQIRRTQAIMQSPLYSAIKESPAASQPEGAFGTARTSLGRVGEFDQSPANFPVENVRTAPVGPSGTYSIEEGRTPEGLRADLAAESLRARGGRYGGAAGFMNDLEAASASRMRTADRIAQLDPRQQDTLALFDKFVGQPAAEEGAFMAEPLKALDAITEKEQNRRAMEALGAAYGLPPGTPVTEESLKTYKGIRGEQRAEAESTRAGQRERRLQTGAENTQQWRMGQPPSPRLIEMRAEQILADEGYAAERISGNWQVSKKLGGNPVANSEQLWADAMRRSQQQLMSERGQSASAVKHPSVVMGETIAKQNPNDPRVLNMPRSIAALKTSHPEMFFPDGKPMPAAVEEAAKQNFGR